MSRRDDRQRAQDAFERDRQQHERPGEAAVKLDPDPRSWGSWCPGWKGGHHERLRPAEGALWRCRWCWQVLRSAGAEGGPVMWVLAILLAYSVVGLAVCLRVYWLETPCRRGHAWEQRDTPGRLAPPLHRLRPGITRLATVRRAAGLRAEVVAMLIDIYADTRRSGTCRSCGAPIEWATVVKSGKALPFNAPIAPVRMQPPLYGPEREVHVVDSTITTAHFATCPQAAQWRQRK